MELKSFIANFNFTNPIWEYIPAGFPNCDLGGLTSGEVGTFQAIVQLWSLNQPEKPESRSRVWKSTNGYIHLIAWSNASLLRVLGRKLTASLPQSEFRLKTQLNDAQRSVIANIEEGFARATTSEYLNFLGFSQGSLKEVKGDIQRLRQDRLLKSVPGSTLGSMNINLQEWHEKLKKSVIAPKIPSDSFKGVYRKLEEMREKEFRFGYPSVDLFDTKDLTYEIFIELINKTDWNLRKLVESLENKLSSEQKYYQVEKLRITEKFKRYYLLYLFYSAYGRS